MVLAGAGTLSRSSGAQPGGDAELRDSVRGEHVGESSSPQAGFFQQMLAGWQAQEGGTREVPAALRRSDLVQEPHRCTQTGGPQRRRAEKANLPVDTEMQNYINVLPRHAATRQSTEDAENSGTGTNLVRTSKRAASARHAAVSKVSWILPQGQNEATRREAQRHRVATLPERPLRAPPEPSRSQALPAGSQRRSTPVSPRLLVLF